MLFFLLDRRPPSSTLSSSSAGSDGYKRQLWGWEGQWVWRFGNARRCRADVVAPKGWHGVALGDQRVLEKGLLGCAVHVGCDGGGNGVDLGTASWNGALGSNIPVFLFAC